MDLRRRVRDVEAGRHLEGEAQFGMEKEAAAHHALLRIVAEDLPVDLLQVDLGLEHGVARLVADGELARPLDAVDGARVIGQHVVGGIAHRLAGDAALQRGPGAEAAEEGGAGMRVVAGARHVGDAALVRLEFLVA